MNKNYQAAFASAYSKTKIMDALTAFKNNDADTTMKLMQEQAISKIAVEQRDDLALTAYDYNGSPMLTMIFSETK